VFVEVAVVGVLYVVSLVEEDGFWVLILQLCNVSQHILLRDDAQQTSAQTTHTLMMASINFAVGFV
jgi:hypothetical protein